MIGLTDKQPTVAENVLTGWDVMFYLGHNIKV